MKKNIVVLVLSAVAISVTVFLFSYCRIQVMPVNVKEKDISMRAVFISYIEYMKYFDEKSDLGVKKEIDTMIRNVKESGLNTIILQVRPFSDAIYPSRIFPLSYTVAKTEGGKRDFDILDYFIEQAHKHNLKLHAWINPYRIRNTTDISEISEENPCFKWLNTNKVKVIEGKGIYYNPADSDVMDLIVEGVKEIVANYSVDGIIFDDYFYPDESIDLENYEEIKNTISLEDYRLSNTNTLVKMVYDAIKKENDEVLFGISPDGNIANNYEIHYADIKKWLKEDGYIDYIMPQIYYGFYHETKPFIETLNEWENLIQNDVLIAPALALYKAGEVDQYAKSGSNEWIENDDIIVKEMKVITERAKNNDKETEASIYPSYGYSLFRYDFLYSATSNEQLLKERENILNFLKF